ncbi:hypothetical protein [Paenibacillus rigui]|nr:hypothetical protein [Paenibacillus rigui]
MNKCKSFALFLAILALLTFSQSAFASASPINWTINTDYGNGYCTSNFREYTLTANSAQVLQYGPNTIMSCHVEANGVSYVEGTTQISFDWSYNVTSDSHYAHIWVYAEGVSDAFEVYWDSERSDSGSYTINLPNGYTGNVHFIADASSDAYSAGYSYADITNITFN